MTPFRLLLCCLFPFVLLECGQAPEQSEEPKTPSTPTYKYESLPLDRLKHIFENATYLDATFYDLPISINQNSRAQIQSTLAGTGRDPMVWDPSCKPIGHIWFQIDGRNVEEADIYFQNQCVGYVWYDDGKPAYSNSLTEQGASFYLNIFQSVDQELGR